MIDPRHILINDFNYPLPEERIAKFPLPVRDESKLLVYKGGEVSETVFRELPGLLPEGSLLVFNNTKVIQARLHFRKESGALIEVFCVEPLDPMDYALNFQQTARSVWLCLVGNAKKWKEGTLRRVVIVDGKPITLTAIRGLSCGTGHRVEFRWNNPQVTFADILEVFGELPIPPYLNRDAQESDKVTYQTVYSKIKGSVAAPTAGLHFTPQVLEALRTRGFDLEELTLHVGAGTFKPVKSRDLIGHEMHSEYIFVHRGTLERLVAHGGRAIAVGTTSVRTLESLYYIGATLMANPDATGKALQVRQWQPYGKNGEPAVKVPVMDALQAVIAYLDRRGLDALHTSTQMIIAPGYEYKIVSGMVTNFHQPQSTLLLLVSAFVHGDWHKIYDYALEHDFRFLSYGDSSLLLP
ncbi:MAG: S-adenosylmethionine:tRNA ribosyltransferase-isomerase [Prevotellaceae bacterium]|nr:S-adenosylmethionine:tRNA ribosyltransferase-isomerase [Prevotellaceae bacterium]